MQHDQELIQSYTNWVAMKKDLPIVISEGLVIYDQDTNTYTIHNGHEPRNVDGSILFPLGFKTIIPPHSALYVDGIDDMTDDLYVEPLMLDEHHNMFSRLWITVINVHDIVIIGPYEPFAKLTLYNTT